MISAIEMSSFSNSFPGIFASNILIREGVLNYNEPVYLSEEFVKSVDVPTKKPKTEKEKSKLKLFPNPADDYFIVQYDFTGHHDPGTLAISDQTGKILKIFLLNDLQNQKIVETNTFSSGIYLVALYVNDQVKAKVKLIIQ